MFPQQRWLLLNSSILLALTIFSVIVVALLPVTSSLHAETLSHWSTFGYEPGHTGYNKNQPKITGLSLLWQKDLQQDFDVNRPLQQVAVSDKIVIANINSRFGHGGIIAFDVKDGAELWRFSLSNKNSINPVTIANNRVYFQQGNHADDTYLFALDLSNGHEMFRSPFLAQWEQYYAPVVADGQVFINGGYYGGMYNLDAFTGSPKWFVTLPQYDNWTPSYANGTVYSYVEGVFTAWRPSDGVKLWSVNLGWDIGATMNRVAAVSGNIACMTVPSQGNSLVAVDLINQKEKWRIPHQSFTGTPAIADGEVYVLNGSALYTYDTQLGQYLWSYTTDSTLIGAPIVTTGNILISSNDHTWLLDRSSHKVLWEVAKGGWLTVDQNRLFIAQPNGSLSVYSLPVYLPIIHR